MSLANTADSLPRTQKDPDNRHTVAALTELDNAREARIWYDAHLTAAIDAYGDHGSLIAGVYRDHYPADVKDNLRSLARRIGEHTERAYQEWQKAGRHRHTLRPFAESARVLQDGRVSYY